MKIAYAASAIAGALTLACSTLAYAEPQGVVVEFGQVVGKRTPAERAETDIGFSEHYVIDNVRFIDHSDQIEARQCRTFGVTFMITDDDLKPTPDIATMLVRHPKLTRPDGQTSTESGFVTGISNGTAFSAYTFDYTWEMEPGTWSFAVIVDGKEIAKKDFTVTLPPPGGIKSECGVS